MLQKRVPNKKKSSSTEESIPIDIGSTFERSLLGLILLSGKYFYTIFAFYTSPKNLSGALEEHTRLKNNLNRKLVRPITFFVINCLLYIYAIKEDILGQSETFNSILKFISEGEIQKVIYPFGPLLIVIGFFSFASLFAAKSLGSQFNIEKSVSLNCYFLGNYIVAGLFFEWAFVKINDWTVLDEEYLVESLAYFLHAALFISYAYVIWHESSPNIQKLSQKLITGLFILLFFWTLLFSWENFYEVIS